MTGFSPFSLTPAAASLAEALNVLILPGRKRTGSLSLVLLGPWMRPLQADPDPDPSVW